MVNFPGIHVDSGSVVPVEKAAVPTIQLTISFRMPHGSMFVGLSGWISAEDDTLLGEARSTFVDQGQPGPYEIGYLQTVEPGSVPDSFEQAKIYHVPLTISAISRLEELRRKRKPRDVILKLSAELEYLKLAAVGSILEVSPDGKSAPQPMALVSPVRLPNLMVKERCQLKQTLIIHESEWAVKFAPRLGLYSFDLIEIPNIQDGSEAFSKVMEFLGESRKQLYQGLNRGAAIAALRNALNALFEALVKNDYAVVRQEKEARGESKYVIHWEKITRDEPLQRSLNQIYRSVRGIVSTGDDATSPHIDPERRIEAYQVESLIGLVSYLTKLITDSISD